VGGKSGLLQGGWFLIGTGSDTWKVPQKIYRPPLRIRVKRRGKSSPSALKAEHGKPHPEQGQAESMGSLP